MRADRRGFLRRGAALASALIVGGCDRLSEAEWFRGALESAESLTEGMQRLLLGGRLAPEFTEADLSKDFKANGSTDPQDEDYRAHVAKGFANWKLQVAGLVEHPAEFSLAELRAMPSRTQITRHDCVEGWSCIGKWTGVPLAEVLRKVGVKPQAKYVVFYCADDMDDSSEESEDEETSSQARTGRKGEDNASRGGAESSADDDESDTEDVGTRYYESVALVDAFHPQTILAYEMNDQTLPVAHGAPLRLRVERQLGYKMAKYVMKIELVDNFKTIGQGKGGYWEDRGYEWYAGI